MRKYSVWWRPAVERFLREYPYIKIEKQDMQAQKLTASYSGMPHSHRVSRSTELAASRGLSEQEERIIDAVDHAIMDVSRREDGDEILKVVKLVDWDRSHTIEGAAMKLHMHRNTAGKRRSTFINLVGKHMGF